MQEVDVFVAIPAMIGTIAAALLLLYATRLIPRVRRLIHPSDQISWRVRAPEFCAICIVVSVVGKE